ncbi:MAG TPA: alkaline phosphatase family protein, partial [Polyangiales bacterium]|nr:alkaline phosphatase family protein [Polyangiales bacterium]
MKSLSFVLAFAWVAAGLGGFAACQAAHANPTVDTLRDVLVIGAWLAGIYGAVFGAFGLAALAGTQVAQRVRPVSGGAEAAKLGFGVGHVAAFACAAVLVVGFFVTGKIDPGKLRSLLRIATFGASLVAAVVATRVPLAHRLGGKIAGLFAVLVLVMLPVRVMGTQKKSEASSAAAPASASAPSSTSTSASATPTAPTPAATAAAGAKRRVFLIGIDGLEWRRIEPLRAKGLLPNFDALIKRGVHGPLHTFLPTWSPILWTTVATGVSANVHGVYDFTETPIPGLDCGIQRLRKTSLLPEHVGVTQVVDAAFDHGFLHELPVSACQRHVEALWNILGEQKKRVAVVNWFASWPAEPVNGYMVSDHNAQRAAFLSDKHHTAVGLEHGITYPEDLLEKQLAPIEVPEFADTADAILALPFFADLRPDERATLHAQLPLLQVFRHIYRSDEFAYAATQRILDKEAVDFLAVYASGVDNTSHRFGLNTGVIDHYYQFVDKRLGELLARADANTSIIVNSDHGWEYTDGPLYAHEHGPDGVIIVAGPHTPSDLALKKTPRLHDIAPTVLALFGYPKPARMEGEVIQGALAGPLDS